MDDVRIMGLEQLSGSDEYRKTIEQLWKAKLRTLPTIWHQRTGIDIPEMGAKTKLTLTREMHDVISVYNVTS
ncbi:hypothetical protein DPMN_070890 [Dreissena polymorpha]|uniref:Uncharacterized protein n=1 Tax=Dreissena polymorpha TaxID=45954 RepID=A0A9D4BXA1_DREPO|nr:hypothetical protein DPMN_070890 [Dreissena polymorpha]